MSTLEPGRAFWFLSRDGSNPSIEGIPVSLAHDIEVELKYNSSTGDGWNMIAAPNNAYYLWGNVEIVVYDNDGNIVFGPLPIYGHTTSGNQNGRTAVAEQFGLILKHLRPPALTMISDRGTYSIVHLARMKREGFDALCSAPSTSNPRSTF